MRAAWRAVKGDAHAVEFACFANRSKRTFTWPSHD